MRTILFLLALISIGPGAGYGQDPSAQGSVRPHRIATAVPTSSSPSLADLVREALQNNPAVLSARHTVEAQRRRVPQARALPDPSVGVGWMGSIRPFSVQDDDPSSYRSISAMQTLPYPGKRKLRGEIASKEADAVENDYDAIRRRVAEDVKSAYYEYWYYDKALQTTQKNKDLLTQLSQIAEARYRVGKVPQQDVLRSQVEISLLLQRLTVLEQQRATSQARLNMLLAHAPESPLPSAEDLQPTPLQHSIEDLYRLAQQSDPGLQREQKMIARNQLAVDLARRDYYPDLSVGYMYQQRPHMPDMHGMTFTVNIPVFYKDRQREEVRQATEERIAAERSRDNRQNELAFELKQQYLAAKASEDLLNLFSQGVIPQSSLALESSMSAYQVGTADFLTVLGNFSTVLNYEVDYYRELANYQTALARMESMAGVDLTSAPPALQAAGGE
ncbi:MAG: TolC family protein [Acidobacteria bacterium]|nr:TolC family protein [Acidobacteriota bacterium]